MSKTTGEPAAYRWVKPPDLAQLDGDDTSGEQLADLVRQAHGSRTQAGEPVAFTQPGERIHAGPIPYGQHHKQLAAYAGWLRSKGYPLREAEACMLMRRRDLVQPPGADRPVYTEAEARAELRDIYSRYAAGVPAAEDAESPPTAAQNGRKLVLTPASEIAPEPVVWAWEQFGQGRIPAGSVGLFAGREGTGKSSFLIWLAAQVTRGELPGAFKGDPRPVIYVTFEDSWKFTIVPRLMAAGADLDLVYRAEVQAIDGDTYSLSLPADNKLLEEAITSRRVALVVIDPLLSAISDVLDTHVNREVRRALDPLRGLVDRTGAVIAGIAHFSKSSGTDASSLITGSGAFKDVARFIFAFATDRADGTRSSPRPRTAWGSATCPRWPTGSPRPSSPPRPVRPGSASSCSTVKPTAPSGTSWAARRTARSRVKKTARRTTSPRPSPMARTGLSGCF